MVRSGAGEKQGRINLIGLASYLCALAVAMLLAGGFGGPWQRSGVTKVYRPYLVLELPVPSEGVYAGSLAGTGEPEEPHRGLMKRRRLNREEYLALLRQHPWEEEHLTFRQGGRRYEIYYVPAGGEVTQVPIPVGYGYSISGNGEDGFVAAVWKR